MLAQVIGRYAYDGMLADMELRAKVERRPITSTTDF
jgi:peptidyl-prolyl cis-trans isomerase D